jgi:glucokinase
MTMAVLAGDVGGTKTLLRLVGGDGATLMQERYESAKHAHLTAMVQVFLEKAKEFPRPRVAAFGVAGPVVEGTSKTTNLPWQLSERGIEEVCAFERVKLMNDFEATAYGVIGLEAAKLAVVQEGTPSVSGNIAVIGAGTGLGEALIIPMPTGSRDADARHRWHVVATEGGHSDFSPRDELEVELLRWLRTRHGHVSWERVVSGMGIANIYKFLRDTGVVPEGEAIANEMKTTDAGAVIGKHALEGTDALCMKTIDVFVSAYGAEAGNLALKGLATGGVYITGGIAPKLLPKLTDGAFLRSYRDKGRLSALVEKASVKVVLDQEVPLRGSAYVASTMA